MTAGPVVLRPNSVPLLTVINGLLAGFFVIQSPLFGGWMSVLSLAFAAGFAIAASWCWARSRRSSVLIDQERLIVTEGRRQRVFDKADIEAVDLSSLSGQVRFKNGRWVSLPLEGQRLVEAGLLLTPRRRRR